MQVYHTFTRETQYSQGYQIRLHPIHILKDNRKQNHLGKSGINQIQTLPKTSTTVPRLDIDSSIKQKLGIQGRSIVARAASSKRRWYQSMEASPKKIKNQNTSSSLEAYIVPLGRIMSGWRVWCAIRFGFNQRGNVRVHRMLK